ncbi:flagellar M-ring protein FliF [Thermocrinis albus DSM 14484]|uniref:Flagellar M-ring protein n=1 Tax=Thermocrinis albus (strain DSM 14484 / JCM 11386 / HI 11/12) TaxID=638303 RepID=D3SQ50_THEAH|nr:flagellar basal-body MS-ring/collar protein FliF [Thermocrinis albus]ADC89287.1 flagellar M-ring protein FliF [Thermocrinis albus DSM 14484]
MDYRTLLRELKTKIEQLSTKQKLILSGAVAAGLISLLLMVLLASSARYVPLYSGLSQEDMSAVLSELEKEGVPYKLGGDGRSVLVPEDKVRDIRLKLAAKGIPSKGVVGYEIFDKSNFAVSDFQNQVNFKRAVEGELAKTIMRIQGVEEAKVNIGMPQRSIFVREEEQPTASVLVRLKPGYELSPEQVKAIRNLVALSVPRLDPKNVVVIDDRGRDLTSLLGEEMDLTERELRIKREYEEQVEKKLQKILEEALGVGNVKVRVSADIDLTRRESKEEIYDPDMTAVVSQQKKKERVLGGTLGGVPGTASNIPPATGVGAGGQTLSERTETITNYEVSKKQIYTEEPLVKVRRLSVGVVVNSQLKNVNLDSIRELVQTAAGIDQRRGDTISVVAVPFHRPTLGEEKAKERVYWPYIVGGVLIASLLVFSLLVFMRRRKQVPLPTPPTAVPPVPETMVTEEIRVKAKEVASLEAVAELAKQEPQKVAKIIKSWLRSKG